MAAQGHDCGPHSSEAAEPGQQWALCEVFSLVGRSLGIQTHRCRVYLFKIKPRSTFKAWFSLPKARLWLFKARTSPLKGTLWPFKVRFSPSIAGHWPLQWTTWVWLSAYATKLLIGKKLKCLVTPARPFLPLSLLLQQFPLRSHTNHDCWGLHVCVPWPSIHTLNPDPQDCITIWEFWKTLDHKGGTAQWV